MTHYWSDDSNDVDLAALITPYKDVLGDGLDIDNSLKNIGEMVCNNITIVSY